ncbi:uncharacterized protein TNCV_669101 [Trichonephila clavipes]|nr:uncharacterized protein TNCV_669101 [Trichonephila clavipes]
MEVTRVEQLAYIKTDAMECHSKLVEALRNITLPYRTVARWIGKFQQDVCQPTFPVVSKGINMDAKSPKMMPTWLYRQVPLKRHYNFVQTRDIPNSPFQIILDLLDRRQIWGSAMRIRMAREDTWNPSEGGTFSWMTADEAVGCTHAFLTMWISSQRLVYRGSPELGLRVYDISRIHWSQHLLRAA